MCVFGSGSLSLLSHSKLQSCSSHFFIDAINRVDRAPLGPPRLFPVFSSSIRDEGITHPVLPQSSPTTSTEPLTKCHLQLRSVLRSLLSPQCWLQTLHHCWSVLPQPLPSDQLITFTRVMFLLTTPNPLGSQAHRSDPQLHPGNMTVLLPCSSFPSSPVCSSLVFLLYPDTKTPPAMLLSFRLSPDHFRDFLQPPNTAS